MKIKNVSNKRIYIFIALAVFLIAAAVAAYTYVQSNQSSQRTAENSKQSDDINYEKPAPEQIETGNDKKTETIEKDTASPQPTSSLNISITASQQNGDVFQIRTLIDNAIANGTCQIDLTQGSKKVTRTAPLQALASSSTCQGFDIPTSDLGVGTWNFTLSATTADGKKGESSRAIEVK